MGKIAYLGLDVHARQSVLGHMDESGTFKISAAFATTEQNIITASVLPLVLGHNLQPGTWNL
jgi:hypothetical protein